MGSLGPFDRRCDGDGVGWISCDDLRISQPLDIQYVLACSTPAYPPTHPLHDMVEGFKDLGQVVVGSQDNSNSGGDWHKELY